MEKYIIDDNISFDAFKKTLLKTHPNDIKIENNIITIPDVQVEVAPQYLEKLGGVVTDLLDLNDPLYFGKDTTAGIVNISVKNDTVFVYTYDGNCQTYPAKYWTLGSRPISKKCHQLKGSGHYRYIHVDNNESAYKATIQATRKMDTTRVYDLIEMQMIGKGLGYFKGLTPKDLKVLSFDIETSGLERNQDSTVYVITNTFRDVKGVSTNTQFRLDRYKNQKEMLAAWADYVRSVNPDFIIGHNLFGFDLDYLAHVAQVNGLALRLGKDGSALEVPERERKYRVDGSQVWNFKDYRIFGRNIIDTMFLSVKHDVGRNFPNWKLKDIVSHLGLQKEDRQFYDASLISKNWGIPEEREKICEYCKHDAEDALALFDVMVPAFFYICRSVPRDFQSLINGASGSWLNSIFVRAYIQDGFSIPKATETTRFEGAISYGRVGVYKNCFKVDVKSMYPSIMRHYKVVDESKDYLKLFPKVVEYFTLKRFEYQNIYKTTKDVNYDYMQGAMKILINSLYGFLGAPKLHFNSPHNAAFITEMGRNILNAATKFSTGKSLVEWGAGKGE